VNLLYYVEGGVLLLVVLAIAVLVLIILSAVRTTSPKAGFVALCWTILIYAISSLPGVLVLSSTSSNDGIFWLIGTVLTAFVASRGGYHWGLSWLWFIVPGIGWWFILWARNNQLHARRGTATAVAPLT
jgi:hypothetical protein